MNNFLIERRLKQLEIEIEKKNFKKISSDKYRGKVERFTVEVYRILNNVNKKYYWTFSVNLYGRLIVGGNDFFENFQTAQQHGIEVALNPEDFGIN